LHRLDDAAQEVDVLNRQPDDLGRPQADERAETKRRVRVSDHGVVQPQDLLGGGHVGRGVPLPATYGVSTFWTWTPS
jgi:hypothetical protein